MKSLIRLILSAVLISFSIGIQAQVGFVSTGNMTAARNNHTATLLQDGRVLIAGGSPASNTSQLQSAEIYDPVTGTFTPTGSMNQPRWGHSAVLLDDGRVLIIGGWISSYTVPTETAEIYDPQTGQFTYTGTMLSKRANFPSAIKLPDGNVAVIGGTYEGGYGTATNKIDIFEIAPNADPSTGTFTDGGLMALARHNNTATLLNDGTILIVHGTYSFGSPLNSQTANSAEIYDPITKTSTLLTETTNYPRARGAESVLLNDNRVLIAGRPSTGVGESVEAYTPQSGTFTVVSENLLLGSGFSTNTLLPGGRTLIIGYENGFVFNPLDDSITDVGPLQNGRANHRATLLNDGNVLLTGGFFGSPNSLDSAELFISRNHISCEGFESPMDNGPVTVKKNRALPLKAQLFDLQSNPVTDMEIALPVVQVMFSSAINEETEDVTDLALNAGEGTEGNQFEYNPITEKWQFNLKIKNYNAPGTYTITMDTGNEADYIFDTTCSATFVIE